MSVHVRVVHDLRYVLRCAINDSFNFPLGLIKYIVIVTCWHSNPMDRAEEFSRILAWAGAGRWRRTRIKTEYSDPRWAAMRAIKMFQ